VTRGQTVGYIRVSTVDQNTARQLDGLHLDRVFEDRASGRDANRPQLQACIAFVRDGDKLLVHSMDRLARNLVDLRNIVDGLVKKGVEVHFVKENLTFTDRAGPMSKLLLNVMGSFAEFEREMIRERQREGIAIAQAAGKYRKARAKKLTPADVKAVRDQAAQGIPKAHIAAAYGISRETLYQYLRATTI
jgi:DNA invertase Pin-like site-specific DNA recombinase